MRVLWIANIPFGKLAVLAGQLGGETSGSWLGAALAEFIGDDEYKIIVAAIGNTKSIRTLSEDNINYCLLPGGSAANYRSSSRKNRRTWENIHNTYKPDLVHVWGTEFSHGYHALQVMKDIPSVIYMQGVMNQIARFYLSGISNRELRSSYTIRDLLKRDWIKQSQRRYYRRSRNEARMLNRSGNVIVENDWCRIHCNAIAPNCMVYRSKLNIKEDFYKQTWDANKNEPYTILSNASGYPIKGLHVLLRAYSLVIRRYPQARLLVAGQESPLDKSMLNTLRMTGYSKLIRTIILNLALKDNVEFLGRISPAGMAERMAKSNVYVMASSIENHSSSLMEAMIVGVPCISSHVGGIPEYLEHNRNGLLYRFEDHEVLASYILKIFEDPRFAEYLSENARNTMRQSRTEYGARKELDSIYRSILSIDARRS